jgi:hypothetical protein
MAITLLNSCTALELPFMFQDFNYGCNPTAASLDCSGNCPPGQYCCYGAGRDDVFTYDLNTSGNVYCADRIDVIIDYGEADNMGSIGGITMLAELVEGACFYRGIMQNQKIPFKLENNVLSINYSYYNDRTSGGPFGIIFSGRIISL